MNSAQPGLGEVILVGGGPGDPDLLTIGGLKALRRADVVLYDHLAPLACLEEVPDGAELIDVGKIPRGRQTAQTEINALLIEHARRGAIVVRLKGGDPFVLGRGSEEWQACVRGRCAGAGGPGRIVGDRRTGVGRHPFDASRTDPELLGGLGPRRTRSPGIDGQLGRAWPTAPARS